MLRRYAAAVASTYGPVMASLWRDALLLPGASDLIESISVEVGDHLGMDPSDARLAIERAWSERGAASRRRFPAHVTPESLESYYAVSNDDLLVTSYWHTLLPDVYALAGVAALHAVQMYADGPQVLEVGHGIGSTGILFARNGLDMTLGDVSDGYAEFARERFERRALHAEFVDLRDGYPAPASFDAVVSLDVVEHVFDPLGLVAEMTNALRPGGLLVLNVAYGVSDEIPEHLLARRRGFANQLRSFDLQPIPHPTLDVFWKRPSAKWEISVRRVQDFAASLAADVVHASPGLARLFRRTAAPPVAHAQNVIDNN